jgi:hypothetical protein
MKNVAPRAREEGLIIKYLPEEVLVYDLVSEKAHCLNPTAALVWKYCDGAKTVKQIKVAIEDESQTTVDERLVWLALQQLQSFDLIVGEIQRPAILKDMSRRELIKRIGVTAVAIPVIISIVAPTAQAQASCSGTNRPDGCPCTVPADCIAGHHCSPATSICGP